MRTVLTCAGCGREVAQATARWCGSCGAPLAPSDSGSTAAPHEHESVVTPVLDDEAEVPVAPGRTPLSTRSRVIGGAVVLAVLGGLLAIQASRPAPPEPHGYTDRGVPARTGVASVEPVPEPGRLAWQTALELPPFASSGAVVHATDELAFVLDLEGSQGVTAHDVRTGDIRWARPDLSLSEEEPVVAGDVVVVGTRDGSRVAVGPDGTTSWVVPQGMEHPVPAGGGIADVRRRAAVTLWDTATGAERWSVDVVEAIQASPQYVMPGGPEDLVVVLANRPPGLELGANPEVETNHLVGIEARTGEIRWVIDLPPGLAWFQAPVAIDDRVAVAANVSSLAFWDLDSGRSLGEYLRPMAYRPLQVVAADGAAVLLDPLGTVTAMDPDGTARWSVDATLPTTLDVRDDRVLVATTQRITLLDAGTGAVVGGLPVDQASRRGPAAPDGGAFVLRRDGQLVAYDPAGGSRFEHETLVPAAAAPAVAEGALYASTGAGVSVFSAEDGRSRWEHRSTDPTVSIAGDLYGPVVADDVVIVSPARSQPLEVGGVFALQRDTGILAWQRLTDRPSPRGPLTLDRDLAVLPVEDELHGHSPVGGRRALAATAGGRRGPVAAGGGLLVAATAPGTDGGEGATLVAIRRADRSRAWEEPAEACTPPAVADDAVLIGTDRGFRALDLATGRHRWNAVLGPHPVCGDLVVGHGRVVGVAGGVTLVAAEVASGAPAWDLDLPDAVAAPPVLAGEEVLVPLLDGTLVAVGVLEGEVRWSLDVGGVPAASPVVADGRIVVLLRDGRLRAFDPA